MSRLILLPLLFALAPGLLVAGELPDAPEAASDAAADGYRVIRTEPFLPADFDQEVLDNLYRLWAADEQEAWKIGDAQTRAKLLRDRYGLTPAPDEFGSLLGYVQQGDQYVMNCFACHGGQVEGQVIPGLPNSNYALQTLTEDVRTVKFGMRKPLGHLDRATLTMPLAATDGITNAVVFGIVLGAFREPDMTVDTDRKVPPVIHHDVDPPPLWNTSRKKQLYIDGFAPKNHRVLMQFILLPSADRETVYGWEEDFEDVLAWIESIEAPEYTGEVDAELASRGEQVFNQHCASCHGTYGEKSSYPEKTIPLSELGTDPVRLTALNQEHRTWMRKSWMSRYGKDDVQTEPEGYVAPPLNGVWASAPYLHNGSVPTLWHLLHPSERPAVWRRTPAGYDHERMGLEVTEYDEIPKADRAARESRRYYDTTRKGNSAAGHDYPDALSEDEKRAVLEYLKTL